jgi:hypothetical protein
MHVSLGLVFLRYLSVAFEAKFTELTNTPHADPHDSEEYLSQGVYWVPEEARWRTLAANARAYVEQHHTLAQSAAAYMQFLAQQYGWEAPHIQRPLPWDNAADQLTLPATLQPRRIDSAPPLQIVGTTSHDPIIRGAQMQIDQAAQTLFTKK